MVKLERSFPHVTVLMPVYNGAAFLREQVETILAQTNVAVHLVILDDGSVDDSVAVATRLAEDNPMITLALQHSNVGLSASVARLLGYVDTPYFAMADQDDIWDIDKLSRSINHLEATGTALTYSDVRLCDERGVVTVPSYLGSRRVAPLEGQDPLLSIFRNPVLGHTIVARRVVAERSRSIPAELRYYEPYLVAAASNFGGTSMVPAQLGCYRVHSANVAGPGRVPGPTGWAGQRRRFEQLSRRQANRSTALRTAARICPDLKPIAALYDSNGPARLFASLELARILRRRCPTIGISHIVREALLLLVWPRNCNRF